MIDYDDLIDGLHEIAARESCDEPRAETIDVLSRAARTLAHIRDTKVWVAGLESELWNKRADPYFLGKHDGVNSVLHRLKHEPVEQEVLE